MAKILLIDIESAPHLVYVWKFWKENVGAKQVVENGYILSWAAKWLGSNDVMYEDKQHQNEFQMLKPLAKLLDEADIVIAHNAARFDIPTINARFIVNNIKPPSPYKIVDTLLIAKKEFRFPSNSLEYLAGALNLGVKKDNHKNFVGFELWLGVLRNDPAAWKEMRNYNVEDVRVLEALYLKLRPWDRFHPNVVVYDVAERCSCPKCGSDNIHYRGYAYTNVGKYHRFQCNDCGGWGRDRFTLFTKEERQLLMVNVVN